MGLTRYESTWDRSVMSTSTSLAISSEISFPVCFKATVRKVGVPVAYQYSVNILASSVLSKLNGLYIPTLFMEK